MTKRERTLTSRHHPHAPLADGELVHGVAVSGAQVNQDLALVHEEAHVHFARVFRALEAFGWQFDETAAEEGLRQDFRVFEFRVCDVVGDDCGRGESEICKVRVSVAAIFRQWT